MEKCTSLTHSPRPHRTPHKFPPKAAAPSVAAALQTSPDARTSPLHHPRLRNIPAAHRSYLTFMRDLTSKKWIVAKGILFLAIALSSAALILVEFPSWRIAALLAALAWGSCRFYYFLFYVLEKYVDPTLRYAGLLDLLRGRKRQPKITGH
jgi:hypothetical protein